MAWKMTPADVAAIESAANEYLCPTEPNLQLAQTVCNLRAIGVALPRKPTKQTGKRRLINKQPPSGRTYDQFTETSRKRIAALWAGHR